VHQIVQTAAIDACVALEALQGADLVVQLIQRFAADVPAGQDRQNLQECGDSGASGPIIVSFTISEHWTVQKLKSEKRPHTL